MVNPQTLIERRTFDQKRVNLFLKLYHSNSIKEQIFLARSLIRYIEKVNQQELQEEVPGWALEVIYNEKIQYKLRHRCKCSPIAQ